MEQEEDQVVWRAGEESYVEQEEDQVVWRAGEESYGAGEGSGG